MSLFVFGTARFCGAVSCIVPRLNRHCRGATTETVYDIQIPFPGPRGIIQYDA